MSDYKQNQPENTFQDRINEYSEQHPSSQVIVNPLATAEMSSEQNYNQIDGIINNLPAPKADLTDGQTYAEIMELVPETLPQENGDSKTKSTKPKCRKFEGVDVIACLGAVVDKNTLHYKTDFNYDKEAFIAAATSQSPEDRMFLWLSRNNGTECFKERDVFIQEIHCHNAWTYYQDSESPIVAFAVEVTGISDGKVLGNLYELDYPRHVESVQRQSQTPKAVVLHLKSGEQKQFSFDQYRKNSHEIRSIYDDVTSRQFITQDDPALNAVLESHREERRRLPARSFSAFINQLPSQQKPSVLDKLKKAQTQMKPPAVVPQDKMKWEPER